MMEQIFTADKLQPGDVLLPGNELVVSVMPDSQGRLAVCIKPPKARRSIWRVDPKHRFSCAVRP